MDRSSSEQGELLKVLKNGGISGSLEEAKLIDHYISRHREGRLHHEADQLIALIQESVLSGQAPQFKPLQLLRFLTKPIELRGGLKEEFLMKINELMPEVTNSPPLLVEMLAIHLRYVQGKAKCINHEMFCRIMDLLMLNNPQATKVILEVTRELIDKGKTDVFEEVWYVGRLMFALERLEPFYKPKLINIVKDLMGSQQFKENLRRIDGPKTLLGQLRRCQNNFLLKMSLLSCIYRLLLSTKTEAIYDFKVGNLPSLLSLKLRQPLDYKEIILNIKILTYLMLDNDISARYIEEGLEDAIILLVRAHPANCHMIKFDDIEESQEQQAFDEFRVLLLRLLRYVSALQKNRKVFKRIFPPQLLGPFFDVGHFVKSPEAYLKLLRAFNQLDAGKTEGIEDEFQRVASMMKNKDYRMEVVGSYSLLQELGQGAFGCVFLAKKGSNEYALKRLSLGELKRKSREREESVGEYFRQVEIYRQLKHPNIVRFYESFAEEQFLYIVMEVVRGCTLAELIRSQSEKGAFFEEETVWHFIVSLLSVLRYLHCDKRVIHRDLNPANIMVDGKNCLKVTDFGLAKAIQHSQQPNSSFVGTLAYSCPQIVQNSPYNEKADIWSFGCIAYELMSLKAPFSGNNPLFLAKNIVDCQYTQELPQIYSQSLKHLVKMCLLPDQNERPDARELLKLAVDQITKTMDGLRERQVTLGQEIVSMNRKINANNNLAGTQRMFGASSYVPAPGAKGQSEEGLRQTQLVKLDSDVLNKIGQDPISKFIDVVKRLSLIASTQSSFRKNFKKYVVDSFYHRVFISDDFRGPEVKSELLRLINLSKEEIGFLGVKLDPKQTQNKSITYEMLYFYIQQLYELMRQK